MDVKGHEIDVIRYDGEPLWRKPFAADRNLEKVKEFVSQKGVNALINKCKMCPLYEGTHMGPTLAPGKIKAVFIGRNPSTAERNLGDIYDMYSRAGQVFQAYLGELGLSNSEVYVTNVCHCTTPKNRPPMQEEILRCAFFKKLEPEIEQAHHIFLMGNDAMKLFFGMGVPSILSLLGNVYYNEENNSFIYPVSHPSFLCMDERWRQPNYLVLAKAREFMIKYPEGIK